MADESVLKTEILNKTLHEISAQDNGRECAGSVNDPCVICLDHITDQAVAYPCQHRSFDFICLVSWLDQRANCPLCQSTVDAVRYEFGIGEDGSFKTYPVIQRTSAVELHQPHATRHVTATLNPRNYRQGLRASRPRRIVQDPDFSTTGDSALARRREIYSKQLYSLHVGSNRLSRFRELSPQLFQADEELVSRARKWIRRELQVFDFLRSDTVDVNDATMVRRANNAEFLLEYIVAILKTVDIQGSGGQAEDMLTDFLGRDVTRLFLHELRAWLRSPYADLRDWDRAVQYQDRYEKVARPRQDVNTRGIGRAGMEFDSSADGTRGRCRSPRVVRESYRTRNQPSGPLRSGRSTATRGWS